MTEIKATNITRHEGHVDRAEREQLLGQKGCLIWFTGLSGSGKSTIAYTVEHELVKRGRLCYVLDGDNIRHGLNKNLGFSAEDRAENIRRISEVGRLFVDAGVITMTAFISPYRADRDAARTLLEEWLREQIDERKVEPNSGLGEAIGYMCKHWQELTLFLREPGAPLDNNLCERALKKAILHRKNSLFYRTENGARVGDMFMSLIHTAELNAVDPFDYLVALQRHHRVVDRDPGGWMPWNYQTAVADLAADPTDPPSPR